MAIASVVTTLISMASLAIVIYREFLQGPRLTSAVDQIVTLHLGEPDKKELLIDMLVKSYFFGQNASAASGPRITSLMHLRVARARTISRPRATSIRR